MIRRFPILLLTLALAACGDRAAPPAASTPSKPAPAPAPAAAATGERQQPKLVVPLIDGTTYDLASHRGRWVVVNFWATWCGPCLKEMPELSKLATRGEVDVIGLAYEDIEPQAMKDFLAEHKPAYPIAIIDTFNPPADFETPRGLPMTVIVAPDGRVAKQIVGPVTLEGIDAVIKAPARG